MGLETVEGMESQSVGLGVQKETIIISSSLQNMISLLRDNLGKEQPPFGARILKMGENLRSDRCPLCPFYQKLPDLPDDKGAKRTHFCLNPDFPFSSTYKI